MTTTDDLLNKLPDNSAFEADYQLHLQHLGLKGLRPKTTEAYSRGIRRIGAYFDHNINDLSEQQLIDYFHNLLDSHSWSTVKLDLYGLKFFYQHVLNKPWKHIELIKPPRSKKLPDMTLNVLRRFWSVHRNPVLLFPNRKGGLKGSQFATTPLDRGSVQAALRQVVETCGIKKTLHPIACATPMPLT